jgi:hypothetical protein
MQKIGGPFVAPAVSKSMHLLKLAENDQCLPASHPHKAKTQPHCSAFQVRFPCGQMLQCPLTEVSPNTRRHVGHSQSSRSLRKGLHRLTNTVSSLAPDAVQSMLKTTTETGDIGQFSVRPSPLPRSGSRMVALRRRSGSL